MLPSLVRLVAAGALCVEVATGQGLPDWLFPSPDRPASVSGKVIDERGLPAKNITVFAGRVDAGGDSMGIQECKTDRAGRFHWSRLTAGKTLLTTDPIVALGGIDLDQLDIFQSYFDISPGQELVVVLKKADAKHRHGRGCGYPADRSALDSCLARARKLGLK